ncbi:MAG: hypothetical protein RQ801_11545 [Spirochaetaceae bacterium]|nr:hypothetical protein [Spirochaetaceae bacterium]MDT8298929.1 hypothetical protein [Spirochaetaceae bacterium]
MEGDLSRAWKRLKKKRGWEDTVGITFDLRETMVRLAPIPKDMAEEMADFYITEPVDEETVYKSEEILEVLTGDWRPAESALTDDDWDFLRELVNAWAPELDMDVVTDVMRVIVDRGVFSRRL